MDAATRAELDDLRRRAYGPSPDIAEDADAVSRLVALEELALPATGPRAAGAGSEPTSARAGPEVPSQTARTSRPRGHGGMVAAVALLAAALGVTGGLQARDAGTARELPEATIIPILIEDATGDYLDVSTSVDVPAFPVSGAMRWAQSLGEHFGWALWIGSAPSRRGDQKCILLIGETGTRSQCAAGEWEAEGALVVSLPYGWIPANQRPAGMTTDQRVAFQWRTGGYVSVALTPSDGD